MNLDVGDIEEVALLLTDTLEGLQKEEDPLIIADRGLEIEDLPYLHLVAATARRITKVIWQDYSIGGLKF